MADIEGAVHLAARIRAGVPVGSKIEMVVGNSHVGLEAGDCGVVREITTAGRVVVAFERGFSVEIDREQTPYRASTG